MPAVTTESPNEESDLMKITPLGSGNDDNDDDDDINVDSDIDDDHNDDYVLRSGGGQVVSRGAVQG